jgi:uncharacterized RDD family membrane protein YckC
LGTHSLAVDSYQHCHFASEINLMSSSESLRASSSLEYAGVFRRIGAMIYDALLVIGVLAVASIPFQVYSIITNQLLVAREAGWWISGLFRLWLVLIFVWFFGFFWTRRGQTLGMQVWKLRVEDEQGKLLAWPLAVRRLLFAVMMWMPGSLCLMISEQLHSALLKWTGEALLLLVLLNLFTAKFSADHRTWHDRMSRTRVVKQGNSGTNP